MRWTEEVEKMTFHLELYEISEDTGDEKPTVKALKKHLAKYKDLDADSKITFGMTSKSSSGEGSVPNNSEIERTERTAG
ncbi:hypothetical protein BDW68DRAFT_179217 [Aspergillus falconensis]